VQLVAEVTEDGEGENIAAVGVVEGEIGGARLEGEIGARDGRAGQDAMVPSFRKSLVKVMSSSVEHFRLLRLDGPKTDQPDI
jgi:hypothetical protein